MTQDVRQWLAEIRNLQQKLTEAHQERDEAFASAANWRSLYETEAKQRRAEARLSQQTIEALQLEIQQMGGQLEGAHLPAAAIAAHQDRVNHLTSMEELRQALLRALLECDRLKQTLATEQSSHDQTRKELTLALGDTVDVLAHERSLRESEKAPSGNPTTNGRGQNGSNGAEVRGLP
jgi:hypothetical protein